MAHLPLIRVMWLMSLLAACTGDSAVTGELSQDLRFVSESLVVIDGIAAPSCSTCSIEIEALVTIGDFDDSLSVRGQTRVVRDSRGRTYATEGAFVSSARVLVYDEEGKFAGVLGAVGQGPGEYLAALDVVIGPGDTVVVLHYPALSLFAPDGRYVRQIELPHPALLDGKPALLNDGTVILAGVTPESRQSGLPLHLREAGDDRYRSFGTVPLVWPKSFQAQLATSGDSAVWTYEPSNYRLEKFDSSGRSRKVVVVRNPDIHAYIDRAEIEAAGQVGQNSPTRGASGIRAMVEDRHGRIWTVRGVRSAGSDTVPVTYDRHADHGGRGSWTLDYSDRIATTIIEVLDPEGGLVLARREVPGVRYLLNDGTMYRLLFTEDGLIRLEIVSLRLLQ